jgi:hypothetical protein
MNRFNKGGVEKCGCQNDPEPIARFLERLK